MLLTARADPFFPAKVFVQQKGSTTMGKFYSDTLEEGIKLIYFQSNPSRYSEGVKQLEKAVEDGEPDAYYFLARCYAWEDGDVPEDELKARQLSREGISKGSDLCVLGADRMNALQGDVRAAMQRPLRESFEAVLKVAEAGEPMAQYAIGLFYFWGDMLADIQKPSTSQDAAKLEKENAAEALKWFRASAEQGCIPAFRNAFNSVRNGVNGVKKDIQEALKYAEGIKTCDISDYYAEIALEYEALGQFPDAIRWYQKGVERGDPVCCNNLGMIYLNGWGGTRIDRDEAFRLFLSSSVSFRVGLYNLGRCYCYGWGVPEDKDEAFKHFTTSAEMGYREAQKDLAWFYYEGYGTNVDYARCVELANKSANQGCGKAKTLLGKCHFYGKGVMQNYDAARRMFLAAAEETNDGEAYYYLGQMYDHGLGVESKIPTAVMYYQKAAANKYEDANKELLGFRKTIFGRWKRRKKR